MMRRHNLPGLSVLVLAALLHLPAPAMAVQPDEILPDPGLEARAREISKDLRCLVCRNENIDDSNAGLARDLRLLVRERLVVQKLETIALILPNADLPCPEEQAISQIIQSEISYSNSRAVRSWETLAKTLDLRPSTITKLSATADKKLSSQSANTEVVDYVVDRYGEYVLLRPRTDGANRLLYWAGPAMLVLGAGIAVAYLRRRKRGGPGQPGLSPEEEARLAELMKD